MVGRPRIATGIVKLTGIIFGLVTLGAVALLDHLTRYELELSTYYLLPVVVTAWFGGRWAGIAFALVAGLLWVYVDYQFGGSYTSESYRYWRILMVFGRFVVGSMLFSQLRISLDLAKRLANEKAEALRELEQATAKLRELEGSFQTVCSWTKKIKDGEEWITLEEYLRRHLKIEVTHGISPEGRDRFWGRTPMDAGPKSQR
ncbi:MAG: DUF4118 domain-containing protein [Verrucomicrobia bacterium]|nr:DUF4118 domain-containing protein [Verrucomicrobiota bacterium]